MPHGNKLRGFPLALSHRPSDSAVERRVFNPRFLISQQAATAEGTGERSTTRRRRRKMHGSGPGGRLQRPRGDGVACLSVLIMRLPGWFVSVSLSDDGVPDGRSCGVSETEVMVVLFRDFPPAYQYDQQ